MILLSPRVLLNYTENSHGSPEQDSRDIVEHIINLWGVQDFRKIGMTHDFKGTPLLRLSFSSKGDFIIFADKLNNKYYELDLGNLFDAYDNCKLSKDKEYIFKYSGHKALGIILNITPSSLCPNSPEFFTETRQNCKKLERALEQREANDKEKQVPSSQSLTHTPKGKAEEPAELAVEEQEREQYRRYPRPLEITQKLIDSNESIYTDEYINQKKETHQLETGIKPA